MDEILKSVASQAPGLVVLCFVVRAFLMRDKERDELFKQMHGDHIAARGESREAIKENTDSNRAVSAAILKLERSCNFKQL